MSKKHGEITAALGKELNSSNELAKLGYAVIYDHGKGGDDEVGVTSAWIGDEKKRDNRLAEIDQLMRRGIGLCCAHYAVEVPKEKGGPDLIRWIEESWNDQEEYMQKYKSLASRFIDNFKIFAPDCTPEVREAGPMIKLQSPS